MHADLSLASFSLVFFNDSSHSQFTALEILSKCLRVQGKRSCIWLYANALPFLGRPSTDFGAHRDPGTNPCVHQEMDDPVSLFQSLVIKRCSSDKLS